jgi:hypothetical protein
MDIGDVWPTVFNGWDRDGWTGGGGGEPEVIFNARLRERKKRTKEAESKEEERKKNKKLISLLWIFPPGKVHIKYIYFMP